jgi:hypothetical protein
MKLCVAQAVLFGMVAVNAGGQPQTTPSPSVSPAPSAATTASPSAADAEYDKLMKDPEWRKLFEAMKKFKPGTPEWRRLSEKEQAYEEKVAPASSEQLAEKASIRYLRIGGHSGTVDVARDELTLVAVMKAAAVHDVEGIALMRQSGELFDVPAGTKVRYLGEFRWQGIADGRGILVSKVRILEGEHYGKTGWVPDKWLESEAATQR